MVAALRYQRNSIGIEIDPDYCRMIASHLKAESSGLFQEANLIFERAAPTDKAMLVQEEPAYYHVRPSRRKME